MKIFKSLVSKCRDVVPSVTSRLTLFVLLAGVSGAASAYTLDNPPASIKKAEQNGIKLIEQFDAANGWDGWLVKNRSGYNIWYSDDAGYVFVGALLDPNGNNLTAGYLDKKAPKPDYKALLESATYISTQPDKPSTHPVYVFYEPHCGYCSAFHAAAAPYVKNGADVRWVPVAFLRRDSAPGTPSSMELVAKILKSSDPLAVIEAHEHAKAISGGRQGLSEGAAPDASVNEIANKNSVIMNEMGFQGTPAIAYIDENGEVKIKKGIPSMAELATIMEMDRMDSADGRLGNFGAKPNLYPVK